MGMGWSFKKQCQGCVTPSPGISRLVEALFTTQPISFLHPLCKILTNVHTSFTMSMHFHSHQDTVVITPKLVGASFSGIVL